MLTVTNPRTFDWAGIGLKDCLEGNAFDAYFTLKLYRLFEGMLSEKLLKLHRFLISPALEEFYHIEYEGLEIDREELDKVDQDLRNKLMEAEDEVYTSKRIAPTSNLNSSKDLIGVFYTNEDGFALYPPDRTSGDAPSTDAKTLKLILQQIEKELEKRA